jgi:diguanylate cyclase (GGDEF)-like protein
MMRAFDMDKIVSLQHYLSSLTGLRLSLYKSNGEVIAMGTGEREKGQDDFVKQHVGKALLRKDISFQEDKGGVIYFFLPFPVKDASMVIVGRGRTNGSGTGPKGESVYGHASRFRSCRELNGKAGEVVDVKESALFIRAIFDLFLHYTRRPDTDGVRGSQLHTLLTTLSHTDLEREEIFDILVSTPVFLFDVESVSVTSLEHGILRVMKGAGLKEEQELKATGVLLKALESDRFIFTDSLFEIMRVGLPETVHSLYSFPVAFGGPVTLTLNVFNTVITEEGISLLELLCRFAGRLLHLAALREGYERNLSEIRTLKEAAERLIAAKEPDVLYKTIVDASMSLTGAEKGSLMMAGDDSSILTVKAARGIHPSFLSQISMHPGEGVAGKVFQDGVPLRMDDIGAPDSGFHRRHKYRTGAFASFPLKTPERVLGVLSVCDKLKGETFSDEDMLLMSSFSSYAAIALERSLYYSLAGQLRELSVTDSLTDLFNRRYFEERLYEELNRSDRHALSFSLLMIDIDDFKIFNDSEGHLAGDDILKAISSILKECVRMTDVVARFGGEEFTVIMPQTLKQEAKIVAERIRESVKEGIPGTRRQFQRGAVTVSIGVAMFPEDGRDRRSLLRSADRALYMAKMQGKDRIICAEA